MNNNRYIKIIYLILLIPALLYCGTDGTIRGTVKDREGSPMIGAQVFIKDIGPFGSFNKRLKIALQHESPKDFESHRLGSV